MNAIMSISKIWMEICFTVSVDESIECQGDLGFCVDSEPAPSVDRRVDIAI